MELICRLVVVNRQGGVFEDFSKGSISVRSWNKKSTPSKEPFILVCMESRIRFTAKYNVIGNIEGHFTQFLHEGRATLCLKEPSCNIFITKADPDKLKAFIVYLKKLLPADSPVLVPMAALEPPISRVNLYLYGQEEYKLRMENVIRESINLDQFTYLNISKCTLEFAGDQVPISGAIRKMTNLTTLHLEFIKLRSSTFLEIESKELKQLHYCWCETRIPIASLFKNDLCYKDSLVELNLYGNRWSEIPKGIFQFQNLLKLSLGSNRIHVLPDRFTDLPKLQELDLSHNEIRHLPLSIFALQNLSVLSLSGNDISKLPNMFSNLPKLETLKLCDNHLRRLPHSIFALQNLSHLSLSKNHITELPDKFTNLSKLKYLSLAMNQLQYLPPSICSLHLSHLDFVINEFYFEIPPSVGSELIVHSLKELSYRTILKHKLKVEEGMLPKKFLKDLDNYRQCICGCKFVDGQEISFILNLNNILSFNFFNHDPHLRFPIRGKLCNSLQSCFLDRFTKCK